MLDKIIEDETYLESRYVLKHCSTQLVTSKLFIVGWLNASWKFTIV